MPKILIAPDSFKGSLSARDLCAAIREGVQRVFPAADIREFPLADGGEGTLDNLIHATNGTPQFHTVRGPLGEQQKVRAAYGVLGTQPTAMSLNSGTTTNGNLDSTSHTPAAVIEMAQASGLTLVPAHLRDPLHTTTYGTGELIRHALDAGHRRFLVGLGGSATNDGGTGMLRALGMQFYDADGRPLPEGGGSLTDLVSIDAARLDPRLHDCTFRIASDVTNPLTGPDGASRVYGPQKGATPENVAHLDAALHRFGEVILHHTGRDIRTLPGSGAAGGLGAAFLAYTNAVLESGISLVLEALDFHRHLPGTDLLITGEGRLDAQTRSGKVISGVTCAAREHGIPVVALCGSLALTAAELDALGVTAAFPLAPGPCTLDEAMTHTAAWAADRTEQILRLFPY